ncbi:MAG: hypothetical protein ACI959_001347, partial [Limisphaerales bacterium]
MFTILIFAICSTVFGAEPILSSNYNMYPTMDPKVDFAKYPEYSGEDLGITWSRASSKIKVWAPTADAISWRLYEDDLEGSAFKSIELRRGL